MAYYSGTATSLANLLSALTTHAVADGWTLTGDVLSKAGVYFQLQATATNITCLGCESNAVANPAPGVVMIGRIFYASGHTTREISFPCTYEVFGFAQELYLVVNYDVDKYQFMAFGKSTVSGLIGQGGWCSASVGSTAASGNYGGVYAPISYRLDSINSHTVNTAQQTTGQMFAYPYAINLSTQFNSWVNHGLDAHGWGYGSDAQPGTNPLLQLLWMQPSGWNSESALLPIRAWKPRPSYKLSMIADMEFARRVRLDNLTPGDVLTIGPDKWKVFPWHAKNATARNGSLSADDSGTFGWAIRYQGP